MPGSSRIGPHLVSPRGGVQIQNLGWPHSGRLVGNSATAKLRAAHRQAADIAPAIKSKKIQEAPGTELPAVRDTISRLPVSASAPFPPRNAKVTKWAIISSTTTTLIRRFR